MLYKINPKHSNGCLIPDEIFKILDIPVENRLSEQIPTLLILYFFGKLSYLKVVLQILQTSLF